MPLNIILENNSLPPCNSVKGLPLLKPHFGGCLEFTDQPAWLPCSVQATNLCDVGTYLTLTPPSL